MKISYNWLNKDYFGGKLALSAEKLADVLSSHAFEVEGIEKLANDTILDIKVLPDRAHYALCHRGIAREASAISLISLAELKKSEVKIDSSITLPKITVLDSKLCPRYMARRIDNIKVSEERTWLSERLEAIGARSINNIVDATNFIMFDIGQPLHAFDADKIKGNIIIRKANTGEQMTLLDGREVVLTENDLLIADDEGPLVIAGVKGGKRAQVTKDTKSIIIESANFNPITVRRTSTRLNLRNDSSKRFENEITPELAEDALNRVTGLILELSQGSKAGILSDIYPNPVKSWFISVNPSLITSIIGVDIPKSEMENILKHLGCFVTNSGDNFLVTPPLDRLDLIIPEDIADEVVRVYGYENLNSVNTPDITPTLVDKTFFYSEKVKNILVDLGFSETLLYTLVPKGVFEIIYPLASDKSALRESISPKLIESLILNSRNADLLSLETIKIFEIGKIFPKTGEKTSLCLGISQIKKKKGQTAEILLKEVIITLENYLGTKLDTKIMIGEYGAVIEIDFDLLISKLQKQTNINELNFVPLSKEKKYKPFSHYPFMTRDIAVFVPKDVSEIKLKEIIKNESGELLIKNPELFDRFEKDEKISFAFRMIFQSFERTLEEAEITMIMNRITEKMNSNNGWQVR